jgi:hypothetical protein
MCNKYFLNSYRIPSTKQEPTVKGLMGPFNIVPGQAQWLTPVIPPTQAAEIRKTVVQGQPGEKVHEIPSRQVS